ncbi:unnamed protein product [Rotaria sordida]|uniref:Uncharacterized protein n=1 Tax=Rotaria sordida TaxID=392033 RepID=A0A815P031_9BILA|nr:unnamed protein product [Rotaria sordida]CAF1472187.1 unnamed protein product [Rotaria sordida]
MLPAYASDPDAVLKDQSVDIQWRNGIPNYNKAHAFFEKYKTTNHKAGSLEAIVQNLVKNWEKEVSHKNRRVWVGLTSGINLNVFKGFADENDLVEYFLRRAYHDNYTVIGSVVFTNVHLNDTKLPPNTIYKIRQNASLTPSTKRVRDLFWVPSPPQKGFMYYNFGFSWIQEIIDRAIIDTHVGRPIIEPGLFYQEMSYPCYTYDK